MTQLELYNRFRTVIGILDPQEMSDNQIATYFAIAAEWLAMHLRYPVRQDTLTLQTDVADYPLPADFYMMINVEWNARALEPTSLYRLDRQSSNWRQQAHTNPREYFVYSRTLTLFPTPDSGAVSANSGLIFRYLGSPLPVDSGTVQLGEADQNLLIFRAALLYCRVRPSEENAARQANLEAEVNEWLPLARLRAQNALREYRPRYQPEITRRFGAR